MVANLSAHKRGWDARWAEFSDHAARGQALQQQLLAKVEEDTASFNGIMAAFRLPKGSTAEQAARRAAIQAATRHAVEVPLSVMRLGLESMDLLSAMAETGNPNSVSDAGVGALCARSAVYGAYLNVKINLGDLKDKAYVAQITEEAEALLAQAQTREDHILAVVKSKL